MLILIPALVCLIGLVIYSISENAKVQKISGDMFWCGLLITLHQVAHAVLDIKLGGH